MNAVKFVLIFVVLSVLLFWITSDGRLPFKSEQSLKTGVQNAGEDLKSLGRDTASSIRKAVQ